MKTYSPRRRIAVVAAAMLTASLLAGCTTTSTSEDGEVTKVRYQGSGGQIIYTELAAALGYLDGLELEWVGDAQGGPASLQALATGETDITIAPFNGAIAKVASVGVPIKAVVAGYGANDEVSASIVTLEDSPVRTGKDLIGRKIAVNTLGANAEAIIDTYLRNEGLTDAEAAQVTLVALPPINQESALRESQVDAVWMSSATKELALRHGGIRVIADDTDFAGTHNAGSYVLTEKFIQENPATAETLAAGLAKAAYFEQTHSRDEVLGVYGDWLAEQGRTGRIESLELWKGNGVATEGGVLRDEDFTLWLDWLESSGEVDTGSIKVEELYTNEFNPFAEGQKA